MRMRCFSIFLCYFMLGVQTVAPAAIEQEYSKEPSNEPDRNLRKRNNSDGNKRQRQVSRDLIIQEQQSDVNTQIKPCLLYFEARDNLDDDETKWICKMKGQDATNAGAMMGGFHAYADIQGIEYVLAANPDIVSGETLLFAEGAVVEDHLLVITPENELKFDSYRLSPGVEGRRRLRTPTGNKNVLVARVSATDTAPSYTAAQLSDAIFGTSGDPVNLKSQYEGCSADKITITPATGTGTACRDNPNYTGFYRFRSGSYADCDWFEYFQAEDSTTCSTYGNRRDLGGGSETGKNSCCVCGGGAATTYDNNVVNGVFEVRVPVAAATRTSGQLEEAALNELERQFRSSNLEDHFDLVMLCLPPGTRDGNWVAYAYLPGFVSVYNNRACLYPSVQMHEIGHNVGLTHSSDVTDSVVQYGDRTGMMGISYYVDDGPRRAKMCFNPAKSYTLGWYSDKNLVVDTAAASFCGRIVGVSNYATIAGDEKVVLKIPDTTRKDYYVGYNHATGFHAGTNEARNQVTIVSQDPSSIYSFSYLEARLSKGGIYIIILRNGEKVTIRVLDINTSASGYADIQVIRGDASCVSPSEQPSMSPSLSPSVAPSIGPSQSMVPSSSSVPSQSPSISPSQFPSSKPSLAPSIVPSESSAPSSAPSKTPIWNCIFNLDFEIGLLLFTGGNLGVESRGGGADGSESSLRLIGRGGVTSETIDSYDVSQYSKVRVSFAYRTIRLPAQDVWYLEFQANGGEWTSWETFVWDRYCFAHPLRWCSGEADLELTDEIDTIKFRFRTLFVRGNPTIYIDDVKLEVFGQSSPTVNEQCPTLTLAPSQSPSSAPTKVASMAPSSAVWSCLFNEDFEDGLQFWRGGAVFVSRNGGGADGSLSSLNLAGRDVMTSESSDTYDVSQYKRVKVSLAYRTRGFLTQDAIYLEVRINGGEWTSWESFARDVYCASHPLRWCSAEADLEITDEMDTINFRFRTLRTRQYKHAYIDDVKFEVSGPSMTSDGECPTRTSAPSQAASSGPSLMPSSAPSTAPWNCLFNDDFEDGLQFWTGGAVFISRNGGGADGSLQSLRLIGRGGVTSESNDSYDVSEYSRVKVSFAYRTRGLPIRDVWYLEFQANGGEWTSWETFVWDRYCFAHPLRWCSGETDLELTDDIDTIKFRFRTLFVRGNPQIYIDDVKFEATGPSVTSNGECPTGTSTAAESDSSAPSLAPSSTPSLVGGLEDQPGGGGDNPWNCLWDDDFEDGLRFWRGGAVFVSRNGGGADGSLSSLRLMGRGGVESETSDPYDVSEFDKVRVSFAYRTRGLPPRDVWYLEVQINGGEWTSWETFVWDRYCFAHPLRWCSGEADLEITDEMDTIKFRFRTLFVRGNPQIYIDDVKFEGSGPSLSAADGECPTRTSAPSQAASSGPSLMPSSAPSTAPWNCLFNDDFEDGLQFWTGGAVFVSRNGGGADGSLQSLRLIGRGGVTSEPNDSYDVSEYSRVKVSFAYRTGGLPIRDVWYLEFQANGGEWTSWETFVWDRYCFYYPLRWCSGEADLEVTDIETFKFRFRTLFVRGNPQIYIDDVKFEATGPSVTAYGECPT